jgi:hypothetical protein
MPPNDDDERERTEDAGNRHEAVSPSPRRPVVNEWRRSAVALLVIDDGLEQMARAEVGQSASVTQISA